MLVLKNGQIAAVCEAINIEEAFSALAGKISMACFEKEEIRIQR